MRPGTGAGPTADRLPAGNPPSHKKILSLMGIGYFVTTPHNQLLFSQLRTRTKFKADCVSKKSFLGFGNIGASLPPAERRLSVARNPLGGDSAKTLKFGVGEDFRLFLSYFFPSFMFLLPMFLCFVFPCFSSY